MTIRARLEAETDGLATAGWLLPAYFTMVALPIAVYAFVARGGATLTSWSGDAGSAVGEPVWVELYPSLWILLLCVVIGTAGHLGARGAADRARAVAARRAAIMATWAVVAAATFGGFAWLVLASTLGTEVGVPFPLMGTVSPAP